MTKKTLYLVSGGAVVLIIVIGLIIWLRTRGVAEDTDVVVTVPTSTSTQVVTSTVVTTIVDSDKDGVSDDVEVKNGTDIALFDTDADGFGDYEESVFGSDPKNPQSKPVYEARPEPTSEVVVTSTVESPDVTIDSDADTIPDAEESRYGTDPNKKDTDGDTFTDADEIKNGYNPLGPGRCAVSTCIIK